MTRDEILQAFDRMRVWQRGDRRAVHKPLLVLLALAKVGAGGTATERHALMNERRQAPFYGY